MNVLFLTYPYPNYVPDLLLHGLRKLLGPAVVDYPRKDSLYRGEIFGVAPEDQLISRLFPPEDTAIDREDIAGKIEKGFFRYIVCDSRLVAETVATDGDRALMRFGGIRSIPLFQDETRPLPRGLALIDGNDYPFPIPPGPYVVCRRETDGTDGTVPLPMALPEEIWQWIHAYRREPKAYSVGFLGSNRPFFHGEDRSGLMEAIAARYPDSLLGMSAIPTADTPSPSGRMGRDDYYRGLQQCRVVLSLRGEGYDTFRFWENAACSAVHVAQRMPLYIPDDFEHGRSILRFSDADEMIRLIDMVLDGSIRGEWIVQESHRRLARYHTTERRAAYFLDRMKASFS